MGIFDKFFNKPISKKDAPTVMINRLEAYMGKSVRKYKDYAREGFQDNAIVHRCVKLIADSASAVKIKVFDGENELENHELISLLERPNPLQSGGEYFQSLYSYLMISGNSYLLRDTENDTAPRS